MLLHNFVLLMEMTFDDFFYDFLIKYFFPYISCVIKNVDKTLLDRIILVITKHSPSFILYSSSLEYDFHGNPCGAEPGEYVKVAGR